MNERTWRQKLQYKLDIWFAKGFWALVLLLFLVTIVTVFAVSLLVFLFKFDGSTADKGGLFTVFWDSVLRTLDPGTMGQDRPGKYGFAMLLITMIGIFVISTLIGIINQTISDKISQLRRGRSQVLLKRHTVVLGWTDQIFIVLQELVEANANHRKQAVVVMSELDKVEMEERLKERIKDCKTTSVICRTGSLMDAADLRMLNLEEARSVIVLPRSELDNDIGVIKALLAINSLVGAQPLKINVVTSLMLPSNLDIAHTINPGFLCLDYNSIIGKLLAHSSLQPGLAAVYKDVFDYEGSELYVMPHDPSLVGQSYHDLALRINNSSLIGFLGPGGRISINPLPDAIYEQGFQLIVFAEDDDTTVVGSTAAAPSRVELIFTGQPSLRPPEHVLILGWNNGTMALLQELDQFISPNSRLTIVPCQEEKDFKAHRVEALKLKNLTLEYHFGDLIDRQFLQSLDYAGIDHIILLSCKANSGCMCNDERTIFTLIIIRDILAKLDRPVNIISEMNDDRNRPLLNLSPRDDIIISEYMVSMMMTQISENPQLLGMFHSLLDSAGSEIYLKPVREYVKTGVELNYATLVEAGLRQNETVIGYRLVQETPQPNSGFVLNPRKTDLVTFDNNDLAVVLAEDWS